MIDYICANANFEDKNQQIRGRRGGKSKVMFVPGKGTVELADVFHKKIESSSTKRKSPTGCDTDNRAPTKKKSSIHVPFKMPRLLKLVVMNPVVVETLDHGGMSYSSSGIASGLTRSIMYDLSSDIVTVAEKKERNGKLN